MSIRAMRFGYFERLTRRQQAMYLKDECHQGDAAGAALVAVAELERALEGGEPR